MIDNTRHDNSGGFRYPRQGAFLGKTVEVYFNYDTSATVRGKVIRDDAEKPGLMIIQLEDGRAVRSTECQYSLLND
jgi:hypothetical protein